MEIPVDYGIETFFFGGGTATSRFWMCTVFSPHFPQEMFSPFIEAAVDSMKRYVSDDTALEAFSLLVEGFFGSTTHPGFQSGL